MNLRPAPDSQGTILLGAAAILTAAICLGLLANQFSSRRLPLFGSEQSLRPEVPSAVAYIGLEEVNSRREEPGVLIIDARLPEEFAAGHIEGAVSLPVADFDGQSLRLQARLRAATSLICYCDGIACDDSARLCTLLSAAGYQEVMLMFAGWEGWQQAGYPTSSDKAAGR